MVSDVDSEVMFVVTTYGSLCVKIPLAALINLAQMDSSFHAFIQHKLRRNSSDTIEKWQSG